MSAGSCNSQITGIFLLAIDGAIAYLVLPIWMMDKSEGLRKLQDVVQKSYGKKK